MKASKINYKYYQSNRIIMKRETVKTIGVFGIRFTFDFQAILG
jgi:hypothetical protein